MLKKICKNPEESFIVKKINDIHKKTVLKYLFATFCFSILFFLFLTTPIEEFGIIKLLAFLYFIREFIDNAILVADSKEFSEALFSIYKSLTSEEIQNIDSTVKKLENTEKTIKDKKQLINIRQKELVLLLVRLYRAKNK